jgi:hypothetical protein
MTSRQLPRPGVGELGETGEFEEVARLLDVVAPPQALRVDRKEDVVEDVAPLHQHRRLEHHADVRRRPGDPPLEAEDGALRRAGDAGDQPEQGRLAAAARADDGDELLRLDGEGDVAQREDVAVAGGIALGDALDADRRHRPAPAQIVAGLRPAVTKSFV